MKRLTTTACILLAGCIWITDGDHADRQDMDGDGLSYELDCDDDDASVGEASTWYADGDGDGYGDAEQAVAACEAGSGWVAEAGDCDDSDAAIHPGADESCDGEDNDCDDLVDDDDDSVSGGDDWYPDADLDGYGDGFADPVQACEQPADHTDVDSASDCDDTDDSIYPGADEYCDEIDHDCDGEVDDDDAVDAETWYLDDDGDGYGVDDETTVACELPSGYAAQAGDCDDSDEAYNPGAAEDDCADPADYNCDGSTGYTDDDGDGWAACEECDDSDAAIHPGADESCDGVDNDCDEDIDEDPVDGTTWYIDKDADGFGSDASTVVACDQPSGYDDDPDDCDDSDAAVNPAATEVCNELDDDCNGLVDDADPGVTDASDWYPDMDTDGYGDAAATATVACDQPTAYVADNTDCDDTDAAVSPGASEAPGDACFDSLDNDCDGDADAAATSCAACPDSCASTQCLWVDGVLEAESSATLDKQAFATDTLLLEQASFDNVLLAASGAVLVYEDFSKTAGCFTGGTVAGGVLDQGGSAACTVAPFNAHLGDWVVSMTVVADSTAGSAELQSGVTAVTGWFDWAGTPYLEDAGGQTPFTSGAPDPAVDHELVLCGTTP